MSSVTRNPHTIHLSHRQQPAPTPVCYIQNATLLTFMPPFILIYMYMFELILISQLHPYEKIQREKRQNTDWILQQLLEKKMKRKA